MGKLIIGTFLVLGLVFYELSGGADFVPESRISQVAEADIVEDVATPDVTRSTSTLVNLSPEPAVPEAEIIQAVAEAIELDDTEEATVAPEVAEVVEPIIEPTPLDLRLVAGSRVNMRSGPGTTHDVLDTLDGGTETEVLEVNAGGWAKVRVTNTGQIGWMAERLLTNG